jgi:hypothetical protein
VPIRGVGDCASFSHNDSSFFSATRIRGR